MRSFAASAFFLLCLSSIAACGTPRMVPHDAGRGGSTDSGGPSACGAGTTSICRAATSIACNSDGSEGASTTCTSGTCVPNVGCRACFPGTGMCAGNVLNICRTDGSGFDMLSTCNAAAGEVCNAGTMRCSSPCADAEANGSYIGCEYWPVATLNNVVGQQPPTAAQPNGEDDRHSFHFGVAIANPGTTPATVTVERGGTMVATTTVAGGDLEVLTFPWDDRLQPDALATTGTTVARGGAIPSVLVRNAAYHLTSTVPVTVYQFNPLEYTVPGPGGRAVFSYSNDASLLLPSHALTGNYIVVARGSHLLRHTRGAQAFTGESPGFFTLVGVDPSTSVSIQFSAHTVASTDGTVMAFAPGDTGTFTLGMGDVLQITSASPAACGTDISTDSDGQGGLYHYCALGSEYDLTGTQIRSTGRLELIAGHNCDFVPENRWACDHLEEGMFPFETWGDSALVVLSQPLAHEPNVIRIVSGDDTNSLTFDPPSTHPATTLSRGQFIEFEATQSFQVTGSGSLTVAQFLVGENYAGLTSTATGGNGDPSESLAIPTAQYRSQYTFLAPESYAINFVGVSAPTGVDVLLDGAPISGFTGVGGTGFDTSNVSITSGVHTMSSAQPFGIIVYGFGSYTSYMYPGGLDLHRINQPF